MRRIAITGGIACGKSAVGSFLEELGVEVCDADRLAHRLMAPGGAAYPAVAAAFGPQVLAPDGGLDRARLGALVFADEAARQRLNALVHPLVREAWREWLEARPAGRSAAAVIVPLLYEAGEGAGWDAVVCVACSEAVQVARLRERGLTAEEARRRIAAQWPTERKAERADYVIVNDGSRDVLREQTKRVLRCILET